MTQSLKNKTRDAVQPCIWMQAGVVSKKSCTQFQDCTTCKYDMAMEKQAIAGKHMSWQEALRKRDSRDRSCRHTLTGRADHRTCAMNYNCSRCDFDQLFEDVLSLGKSPSRIQTQDVKGFKLADGYCFHFGHTWADIDRGGFIRVGMDDFTFRVLGEPDGFDLPLLGQELSHGKAGWGMKRKQNLADILSPVNGVITKVNPAVTASPGLPGEKPYEDGWLFTVHHPDPKEAVRPLMEKNDSVLWLNSEITALEEMIEAVTGPLSADGGLLTKDIFGTLPALGWENLIRRFLN